MNYLLMVDTDETDQWLELHTNVWKYGTISNTVAEAVALDDCDSETKRQR